MVSHEAMTPSLLQRVKRFGNSICSAAASTEDKQAGSTTGQAANDTAQEVTPSQTWRPPVQTQVYFVCSDFTEPAFTEEFSMELESPNCATVATNAGTRVGAVGVCLEAGSPASWAGFQFAVY